MAKITINCGGCKTLNCEIKKQFRNVSQNTPKNDYKFSLKCPFKTPVFDIGEVVKFTVGHGKHIVYHEWECNLECYEDGRCDGCNNGIKTFKNIRYSGYVEIEGIIAGYTKYNIYAIGVSKKEFNKHIHLFTENDDIHKNDNKLQLYYFPHETYPHGFFSKRKFIKSTNTFQKLPEYDLPYCF